MRFTFCAAVAACGSMAVRPQFGRAAVRTGVATIAEIMLQTSISSDALASLEAARGEMNTILAKIAGPADAHVTNPEADTLKKVIDLIENTIYISMDQAHKSQKGRLEGGRDTVAHCNTDVAKAQAQDGAAGKILGFSIDAQEHLNSLRENRVEKHSQNQTAHDKLMHHNNYVISDSPGCDPFPARTKTAMDAYFADKKYSEWFGGQKEAYDEIRDAWAQADQDLFDAIGNETKGKKERDTHYCSWRTELLAACKEHNRCFDEAEKNFNEELVPEVRNDMNNRIEVKKAGDTLIHQIKFLLGEVNDQEAPSADTSRYELSFPSLPAKGLCDRAPLDLKTWVPSVVPSVDCVA